MRRCRATAVLVAVSIIAVALMLYPAYATSAQPHEQTYVAYVEGYVEGYVMDAASGEGLSGVTVLVGETSMETNISGYFRIDGLSLGDHPIKASSDEYKSFISTLSVTEGENSVLIRMDPIASEFDATC